MLVLICIIIIIVVVVKLSKDDDTTTSSSGDYDTTWNKTNTSQHISTRPTQETKQPEDLFTRLSSIAEYYKQPSYKVEWLKESLDRGRKIELNGYYIMESMKKSFPYFYETEEEEELFMGKGAFLKISPMSGYVEAVMEAAWFYNEARSGAHTRKRLYWQQILIDYANSGNREAQAALCSNFAGTIFSSEQGNERFKERFLDKLWEDAKVGDGYAQLGIGRWICTDIDESIEWLNKAAIQGVPDAYYMLYEKLYSKTYIRKEEGDENGTISVRNVDAPNIEDIQRERADCLLRGAEQNSGCMLGKCRETLADWYETGFVFSEDKIKAIYWYERAVETATPYNDMSYAKRHLEYIKG